MPEGQSITVTAGTVVDLLELVVAAAGVFYPSGFLTCSCL